jgi:adenylate cyclase
MERRLAAILAADVVGYSHLMAEDEAGTYDALRSGFSEVVAPIVRRHGGDVFKTTGDGFLAAFGSVGQALQAAVAIQEAFALRPLRLRMGLNLGDVIAADGDVFGDGVNVAARLESMAESGGIYVSAPVVRSVARNSDIRFVRLGRRRAKNMTEPIEVYAVRWGTSAARPRGAGGDGIWAPQPLQRRSSSWQAQSGFTATPGFRWSLARAGSPSIAFALPRARSVRQSRSCPSTT